MLWPLINRRSGLLIKRINAVEVENMTHLPCSVHKETAVVGRSIFDTRGFQKTSTNRPNVFSEDALATITFTFIWWFRSLENKPQHC